MTARALRSGGVVALAAGLVLGPGAGAGGAVAATGPPGPPAVPAAGRVLVLRPDGLDLVLDGRVVRSVAVRRPVDLADLPWLAGDAAYAAPPDDGTAGLLLGAVLVQAAGTSLTGTDLRIRLGDTGGAGAARLVGTDARLRLRRAVVAAPPGPRPAVPAGLRYGHGSDVVLEDVTLDGLGGGTRGAGAAPGFGSDGGSVVVLRRVAVAAGGHGLQVRDPARLVVTGLYGDHVAGALLDLTGGTGARLEDVASSGATGPALRIRASAGTVLDGLTSTGDALALAAADVEGLRAAGVRARGAGLVVGGRGVELVGPEVDAPDEALRVGSGGVVAVRGGALRGGGAAVAADGAAVLRDVATTGELRGPVRVERIPQAWAGRSWWDLSARGAGVMAVGVLVAGLGLDLLRGRSRDHGGPGSTGPWAAADSGAVGEGVDGELALDLGEQRVH